MKKKLRIIIPVIIIALILLVPIPMHAKDGGTVAYNAVLYGITKRHSMWNEGGTLDGTFGYLTGTEIRILWFTVYDDVQFVPQETDYLLK